MARSNGLEGKTVLFTATIAATGLRMVVPIFPRGEQFNHDHGKDYTNWPILIFKIYLQKWYG